MDRNGDTLDNFRIHQLRTMEVFYVSDLIDGISTQRGPLPADLPAKSSEVGRASRGGVGLITLREAGKFPT